MALPVALQLYSVRDQLELDYAATLRAVRSMGYTGVELPGLNGRDPAELKKMLDDAGLQVMSSHVPFLDMIANPEKIFNDYRTAGCRFAVIPWLEIPRRPGAELYAETLLQILRIGKIAKEYGVTLLYHNHDFEFIRINGEYGLDILYASVPKDILQTQIDTCWVAVAGLEPAAFLRKYKGRAPLVHLKDFYLEGELAEAPYELLGDTMNKIEKPIRRNFEFRPIGHGVQNIPSLLEASVYVGAQWVIVEQDLSPERPTLEAARMSREYLLSMGW